jgi:putative Ig domain-containing protein
VVNADAAITIDVTEVNAPPVLSNVPSTATIPELAPYTFTATATDPDIPTQTVVFSLVGAPTGASMDGTTGVFSWTPTEAQGPGSYSFSVRASDGVVNTDAPVALNVTEANTAPTLSGVPASATIPGQAAYTFTATATDPDLPAQTLTFSLVSAPAGASIDASSGVFTWTPGGSQSGAFPFAVRVSDGFANTDAPITITVIQVTPITDLAAVQVKSGNDADGTTKIRVTWSPAPAGTTVEVFRAGFGGYPKYDDAGGAVPAVPSYPPPSPWVLTSVVTSGTTDEPPTRDFSYYVAFVHGPSSSVSAPSNRTTGTLNYHLGDVSDGFVAGHGDNEVNTLDISLLGAHYGLRGTALAPYAYLDVGPTTNSTPDGRPTTDGAITFEDLIIFSIQYEVVAVPQGPSHATGSPGTPSIAGSLSLEVRTHVAMGDTIRCPITLSATGQVQGVSIAMGWNPATVRPIGAVPGALTAQGAGVVLSPEPGRVDAAFLGVRRFSGAIEIGTAEFIAVAAGDPGIAIASVDARDETNQQVKVAVEVHAPAVTPTVTSFGLAMPNPFRRTTTFAFDLSMTARVGLQVYSVDGRHVRTLMDRQCEPGRYTAAWDGQDEDGRAVGPGVYYARLDAGSKRFTRSVVVLR